MRNSINPVSRQPVDHSTPVHATPVASTGTGVLPPPDRSAFRKAIAGEAQRLAQAAAPNLGEERPVAGTKVNGQQLFERDGHRFYYPNGDTGSKFVSVQQPDGSFKWTTKDAMLTPNGNNFRGNQPHQIGSIETLNGKIAAMYQFPDGSRGYFDGRDWHVKQVGSDSFQTIKGARLSYRGSGGVEVVYATPKSALETRSAGYIK